jgi:predicted NUDIX family NTP pyrophosphohydrolase
MAAQIGNKESFPEIDKAEWFDKEEAVKKLLKGRCL